MRELSVVFVAICWLSLAACATAPAGSGGASGPPGFPSEQAINAVGLSSDQATHARQIYLFRCAKCHRFYDPAAYEDGEWRLWMRKMSKKAHLQPVEQEELLKYLDAYRNEKSAST